MVLSVSLHMGPYMCARRCLHVSVCTCWGKGQHCFLPQKETSDTTQASLDHSARFLPLLAPQKSHLQTGQNREAQRLLLRSCREAEWG